MGSRRYGNGGAASFQAVQSIVSQVGNGFVPKQDPVELLTQEIEKCSRKIWACVGDESGRQPKKARTSEAISSVSDNAEQRSANISGKNELVGQSREEMEVFLNAMKYRDMQLHCKEYGLAATGNKEVLRERLFQYLSENRGPIRQEFLESSKGKPTTSVEDDDMALDEVEFPSEHHAESAAGDDVKMEEASCPSEKVILSMAEKVIDKQIEKLNDMEPVRVSILSDKMSSDKAALESNVQEHVVEMEYQPTKNSAGRTVSETTSSVVVDSGVVGTKSPLRAFVKDAVNHMTHSAQKAPRMGQYNSTHGDHLSPPPSDFTTSTTSSKISGNRVREIVSKLSTNQTNSALSDKLQASKDARMARLAEMREKSQFVKTAPATSALKPAATATSALKPELPSKEQSNTLCSLNTKSSAYTNTKMNLAAQMREKALRKENKPNRMDAPANDNSGAKPAFAVKKAPVADPLGATLKSNGLAVADPLGATLKSSGLGSSTKSYTSVKTKPKSPPRPSQTYEISDREDSDSDDSEDEDGKREKELPKWVSKENLRPALHEQYIGKSLDPDEIFGEVHTCDLEAIFGNQMKSKYRSRTSSGNWSQDRVTAAEKLVYKRTMGFVGEI